MAFKWVSRCPARTTPLSVPRPLVITLPELRIGARIRELADTTRHVYVSCSI